MPDVFDRLPDAPKQSPAQAPAPAPKATPAQTPAPAQAQGKGGGDVFDRLPASTASASPSTERSAFRAIPDAMREYGVPGAGVVDTGLDALQTVGKAGLDAFAGIGAGAMGSVYHTADALRRMTGQERVIDNPDVQALITPPDSIAGKVGHMGEQAWEFLAPIPGGAKLKALKGIGGVAARSAAGGAKAGLITGAQTGGDTEQMKTSAILGAAIPAVSEGIKATVPMIKDASRDLYSRAINTGGGTTQNKIITKNVVPGLIDRKISALSRPGLMDKISGNLDKATQALDDGIDAIKASGTATGGATTTLSTQPILDALQSYADSFVVNGVKVNPVAYQQAKKVQNMVAKFGPDISFESLLQTRRILDSAVASVKGFQIAPSVDGLKMAQREGANAIRRELAQAYPNLARLNAEYSFWKNTEKVLGDTMTRSVGQGPGLMQRGATAVSVAHEVATGKLSLAPFVTKSIMKLIDSTAFKTIPANTLDRFANVIATGNSENIMKFVGFLSKGSTPVAGPNNKPIDDSTTAR